MKKQIHISYHPIRHNPWFPELRIQSPASRAGNARGRSHHTGHVVDARGQPIRRNQQHHNQPKRHLNRRTRSRGPFRRTILANHQWKNRRSRNGRQTDSLHDQRPQRHQLLAVNLNLRRTILLHKLRHRVRKERNDARSRFTPNSK